MRGIQTLEISRSFNGNGQFLISGVPIWELFDIPNQSGEAGHRVFLADPAYGYAENRRAILQGIGNLDPWFGWTPLFTCFCGDPWCAFTGMKLEVSANRVTWRDFSTIWTDLNSRNEMVDMADPIQKLRPINFDRASYDEVVSTLTD